MTDAIRSESEGAVTTITICRPEKRNALDPPSVMRLRRAARRGGG